jgi:hypothetical protein
MLHFSRPHWLCAFLVTDYDAAPAVVFLHNYAWLPVLSVVLYLLLVFYGPRAMMDRK